MEVSNLLELVQAMSRNTRERIKLSIFLFCARMMRNHSLEKASIRVLTGLPDDHFDKVWVVFQRKFLSLWINASELKRHFEIAII